MPNKAKEKVEEIKQETKQYYSWKNMIPRYIFVWFLVVLLWLQFFLPRNWDNSDINEIEKNDIEEINNDLIFLKKQINTDNVYYDKAYADIISSKPELSFLYKKSLSILPDLEQKLEKQKIPTDFKYLVLLNDLEKPIWELSYEAIDKYWLIINKEIDQRLNNEISTNLTIEYIQYLYDLFEEWDLVLMWYFIGWNNLKQIMMNQDQKEFTNLYLNSELIYKYYKVAAYKYVMENISDYIDIENIKPYPELETKTLKLWETKDISKRAKKEWYTFKEIKNLNPWILGNSLPKGRWEIEVYSQ